MKRREGFTLTELLVLIAAGSLVGVVLLASLSDAKEKIRSAACTSNLRVISLAIRLYADDWNGYTPTASLGAVPGVRSPWPKTLGPYLPQQGGLATSRANKVFICPSANYPGFQNADLSLTYSCAGAMLGHAPGGGFTSLTASRPRKNTEVQTNPAETVLVVEGKADPNLSGSTACQSKVSWLDAHMIPDLNPALTEPPANALYLDFRHSKNMNVLYYDGSVRTVTYSKLSAIYQCLWNGLQVQCPPQ